MKIMNPLQMTDWDIKYLFKFIIIIQALLWINAGLNSFQIIHIPIIGEITSFISLLFINGVLILRILRIHGLGNIENLSYSVGLSITVVMILGMIIDIFYPLLGIQKPISLLPLMITFTLFTLLLCYLSYKRDGTYSRESSIDFVLTNPLIFLLLIPLLTFIGTFLVNNYQNNIILILIYIIIALIPILVAFDKFITKKMYPTTIFIFSISLLFSYSLMSNYITGWDIHIEYYFSNLVVTNSYWNFSIPEFANAMLSLVIIVPIFSKISGLSVVGIFKIIYPIIYSLVPLSLYAVFKKQTNDKIAFFACFLFITVFMFFLEMPYLARQEIGELFFVLMIMLMVEKELGRNNLLILSVFFIFGLLGSHYSMDYIFIFLLTSSYLTISLRKLNLSDKYPILARWEVLKFFLLNTILKKIY